MSKGLKYQLKGKPILTEEKFLTGIVAVLKCALLHMTVSIPATYQSNIMFVIPAIPKLTITCPSICIQVKRMTGPAYGVKQSKENNKCMNSIAGADLATTKESSVLCRPKI